MSAFSDRVEREDEEDRLTAVRACLLAREAWRLAGKPGAMAQLEFFPVYAFAKLEAERARQVDRPRRGR